MKQIQIRKDHLVQLRELVLDRLQQRKNTLEPIHVDRVFAELLGEPLPRTSPHRNGTTPDPAILVAIETLVERQDRFETITTDTLTELHRALAGLIALFETRPLPAHLFTKKKKLGRPRTVHIEAPVIHGTGRLSMRPPSKSSTSARKASSYRVQRIRENREQGMVGMRRHKTRWEVNMVRGGKFKARYFPLDTPLPVMAQARQQMLDEYYAKHPRERKALEKKQQPKAPAKKVKAPPKYPAGYVHWTKRPENKEKVRQNAIRSAKTRNAQK